MLGATVVAQARTQQIHQAVSGLVDTDGNPTSDLQELFGLHGIDLQVPAHATRLGKLQTINALAQDTFQIFDKPPGQPDRVMLKRSEIPYTQLEARYNPRTKQRSHELLRRMHVFRNGDHTLSHNHYNTLLVHGHYPAGMEGMLQYFIRLAELGLRVNEIVILSGTIIFDEKDKVQNLVPVEDIPKLAFPNQHAGCPAVQPVTELGSAYALWQYLPKPSWLPWLRNVPLWLISSPDKKRPDGSWVPADTRDSLEAWLAAREGPPHREWGHIVTLTYDPYSLRQYILTEKILAELGLPGKWAVDLIRAPAQANVLLVESLRELAAIFYELVGIEKAKANQ